jgi:hypothetical protein
MKHIIAAAVLCTFGAAAQNAVEVRQMAKRPLSVMGNVVKGAPYSADEITETLQVLADGTRISNQSQVSVYRDGEGRVRRESPAGITIMDPVANVSYSLNPKTMTATKSTMGRTVLAFTMGRAAGESSDMAYIITSGSAGSAELVAKQEAEAKAQALMGPSLDKLKAELAASQETMIVNGNPANAQTTAALKEQLDIAVARVSKTTENSIKLESLGQQVMQGLTAEGTRSTTTIETGAIGNDRPIQIVLERWYSPELQTTIMTKRTDPRTGEETFHLNNVRRGEPGADLFMVPPGYQLPEPPTTTLVPRKKAQE